MFIVAFPLISNINQSACSTLSWVLNSQSELTEYNYKHHWEFPINKKTTLMLTCPIIGHFFLWASLVAKKAAATSENQECITEKIKSFCLHCLLCTRLELGIYLNLGFVFSGMNFNKIYRKLTILTEGYVTIFVPVYDRHICEGICSQWFR